MDHKKQFDFIKNDRFYDLTIPNYSHVGDSVFYEVNLKDLIQGCRYVCSFRFNDLKLINENLQKLKVQILLSRQNFRNFQKPIYGKKLIKIRK